MHITQAKNTSIDCKIKEDNNRNSHSVKKHYLNVILPGGPYNKSPFQGDKMPVKSWGYWKKKEKKERRRNL